MDRQKFANFDVLPLSSVHNPRPDKFGESFLVAMLQLAAATCPEMTAWRLHMMRAGFNRSIVAQNIARRRARHMAPISGGTVTLGGDADNFV